MRTETVTTKYEVYSYEELNNEAKEKVMNSIRNGYHTADILTEDIEYELAEQFKKSDLKVEYSLCYCQGDGLNIYGRLNLYDALENVKDNLTDKEYRTIKKYINFTDLTSYNMPSNNHYCYCVADRIDIDEKMDINFHYTYHRYKNIKHNVIQKFNSLVQKLFEELCSKYEDQGYEYFYEMSEEELKEIIKDNGYEFLADGSIYC